MNRKGNAKHLGNILTAIMSDHNDIELKRGHFVQSVNKLIGNYGAAQYSVIVKLFRSYCMIWYGCQTWDLSCEQNMKRVQECCNITVRKIWGVPYTTHRYLLPHLMQTVDIYSDLVCKYVKFDIMLKCKNENVRHLMKYSKYNVSTREKTVFVSITQRVLMKM